jgi:hypothetical protein
MTGQKMLIRVLIVGVLLIPMIGSGPSPASAADFDKDGYADLAIGVRWEEVSGAPYAGAVNVLYGSSVGISAANDQLWVQGDLIPNGTEPEDMFGEVLAAGDFDGDGVVDLAVGVRCENLDAIVDGGAVQIIYGSSPDGLVSTGSQFWNQDSYGVGDTLRTGMALVPPWPWATLTGTATATWQWACLPRTSTAKPTPGQ